MIAFDALSSRKWVRYFAVFMLSAVAFSSFSIWAPSSVNAQDSKKKDSLEEWTKPEKVKELHKLREQLVNRSGSGMSAQERASSLAALEDLAKDSNVSPAVRYNAVIAIGQFQEGGNRLMDKAVDSLLALTSTDAKSPDYLLLAALIGLMQHTSEGISSEETRSQVVDAFLSVLEPSFAKQRGYETDVALCLQCRALQGLALLKSPSGTGNGTAILDTFRRIIDDPKSDITLLDEAMRGLGSIDYKTLPEDYDIQSLVHSAALLYKNLLNKEISMIDMDLLQGDLSTGNGMTGMGMGRGLGMGRESSFSSRRTGGVSGGAPGGPNASGAPGADADDSQLERILAQIAYDLDSLKLFLQGEDGHGGISAALKENDSDARQVVDSLLNQIENTQTYFIYGDEALTSDFDPKNYKLKVSKKGPKVFEVDISSVQDFLEDQKPAAEAAASRLEQE